MESPELACERVSERVSLGGHNISEDVIYRRYFKGLRNFFNLYKPIADTWTFYDNSEFGNAEIIAEGKKMSDKIFDRKVWEKICKQAE